MASIKDIEQKIENKGATAAGRLSAEEFNTVLSQVIQNMTDITALTASKVGWAEISVSGDTATVAFYNYKNGTQLFAGSIASAAGLSSLHTAVDTNTSDISSLKTKNTEQDSAISSLKTTATGLDTRVTELENRTESSALVCVITGYNLAALMSGEYTADELKDLASVLYSAAGNVILMKTGADSGDSSVSGYTLINEDTKTTDVTARTQSRSYHFDSDTKTGSFTLSVSSSGVWSLTKSVRGRIGSEYITDSEATLTEILLVLGSADTETT